MPERLQNNKRFGYDKKLRTYYEIKVNNLVRYYKTISAACLWIVIFVITTFPTAYSFDDTDSGLDLSPTHLLNYLSYKYKGFDMRIADISVGEMFDDNITYDKKNKREDFVTLAGIGLGVKYEGKMRRLELLGNVNHRAYAKNSDFDNTTEDLTLSFENEFSRHDRVSLNNVFVHSTEPLFNRFDFFDEQFARRGGQFEYFRNKFDIDYTRDVTRQLTIIARYGNYVDIFSGADAQDSFLNKAGFEADYLFSSTTTFSFSYDFANREFENNKDASIQTIAAGIRQYITQKLYFDLRPGIDLIDSFDDENLVRPIVLASLAYKKDADTIALLSFEKRYNTNPYNDDIFNIRWKTTASVTRQLLERLQCSLSIFYGDGEFISSDFTNRFFGAKSNLNYDITKILKGNFTYTYSESDSNVDTAGYTKNTVFFGLSAEF